MHCTAFFLMIPKRRLPLEEKPPNFTTTRTRTLYRRRSHDGILLRCLSQKEAQEVLKEEHDGLYGAHQPGPKLGDRLKRLRYY